MVAPEIAPVWIKNIYVITTRPAVELWSFIPPAHEYLIYLYVTSIDEVIIIIIFIFFEAHLPHIYTMYR